MVLRNLILVINPIIRGKGNHLGSLSAAPDPSEGQEQGGWGVRVQGHLQGVKYIIHSSGLRESSGGNLLPYDM